MQASDIEPVILILPISIHHFYYFITLLCNQILNPLLWQHKEAITDTYLCFHSQANMKQRKFDNLSSARKCKNHVGFFVFVWSSHDSTKDGSVLCLVLWGFVHKMKKLIWNTLYIYTYLKAIYIKKLFVW